LAVEWGQKIRKRGTGEAFAMFAGDPDVHSIDVEEIPIEETSELTGHVQELLDRNYESGFFLTAEEVDRELEECRRTLLTSPQIVIPARLADQSEQTAEPADEPPFR
ncbi:MAG: hypothetical protein IT428_09745, partial [Planctomycetaceae bacterium]|nr:hypothetical protein [Planctomycetaceae bacterium]